MEKGLDKHNCEFHFYIGPCFYWDVKIKILLLFYTGS